LDNDIPTLGKSTHKGRPNGAVGKDILSKSHHLGKTGAAAQLSGNFNVVPRHTGSQEARVLKSYRIENGDLAETDGKPESAELAKAQWIDLCDATDDEKKLVEQTLGIEVSPVNTYEPFQVSTQFNATDKQITLTGLLLTLRDDGEPLLLKVTFVRTKDMLVTVTDGRAAGLSALLKECEAGFPKRPGHDDIFVGLLDMIVDHTDNILDKVGHDLDSINSRVFQHHTSEQRRQRLQASPRRRNRQLERVLTDLGPTREILVKLRRSVLSFRRMIDFLREQEVPKTLLAKIEDFERDLASIAEAESDLSSTAGFLLDGIVGYIGLLQNTVMNILTLITLLLSPPMVIAGIYGMNFKIMPELNWPFGYPFALSLMVVTTAALYLFVRWRGL
jgi:magnesium transporter